MCLVKHSAGEIIIQQGKIHQLKPEKAENNHNFFKIPKIMHQMSE